MHQITILVLFVQVLCLSSTTSGSLLQYVNDAFQVNAPFTFIGTYYLLQVALFVFPSSRQKLGTKRNIKIFAIGVLDAGSNAINLLAYKYSDVGSIMLVLSLVVPATMIFSYIIQKKKLSVQHILSGTATTICAIVYALLHGQFEGSLKLLGDMFAAIAAICYALTSVLNEIVCEQLNLRVYLSRMAVGGLITCLIGVISLDRQQFTMFSWQCWVCLPSYGILVQFYYYAQMVLITRVNAVAYNVSLLFQNVYAFIASIVVFNETFQTLMIFPVIGVFMGVIVYFLGDSNKAIGSNKREISIAEQQNDIKLAVNTENNMLYV